MKKIDKLFEWMEAKDWAADKSWEEIYNTCHRGDWLLWLFKRINPNDLQLLTLAKGHCANTVRHLMKDERSLKAVDASIAFGEGRISTEELEDAARAALAAYAAYSDPTDGVGSADIAAYAAIYASYAAARHASYAAAYAAYSDPTDGVGSADIAAYAAIYASYAAALVDNAVDGPYHASYKEYLQLTADICRKYLPIEVWNVKNHKKL